MLPIFTDMYQPRGSISKAPTLEWLKIRLMDSVQKTIGHYQSNIHSVRSDHPLVQALKHSGSMQMTPMELYYSADSRAPYFSRNLGFTTDYNRGTFKGHKVYPTQDSMIYANSNYIRPFEAVQKWKTLKPLQCLWLDSNFVNLNIPNTKQPITGFSSLMVDIPLMALMYKGYKDSQKGSEFNYGEEEFIATYVLPSILESQVDASCVSALMAMYYGTYEPKNRVDISYFVPAYGAEFQTVGKHVLDRISDTRMSYVQVLQHLPSVYSASGLQTMVLPDFPSTLQVDWAMFATRFKVINFLLDVGGKTGKRANQGFINHLKSYVRTVKNSRIPFDKMSDELASLIDESLVRYHNL